MLNLLRKLRRKEFKGRYLKYAFGEILLVVIGILIALSINNWNELRKENERARIYIDRMIDDLKADTTMLSTRIRETNRKLDQAKYFMDFRSGKAGLISPTQFVLYLQYAGRTAYPKRPENTYHELISTGDFRVIKDINLVNAIRDYYLRDDTDWYDLYSKRLHESFLPLIIKVIPFEFHEEILDAELLNNQNLELTEVSLTESELPVSLESLEQILDKIDKEEEFDFQLKNAARSHKVHSIFLENARIEAAALLEQLEKTKQFN